jgi:hypothetical protein
VDWEAELQLRVEYAHSECNFEARDFRWQGVEHSDLRGLKKERFKVVDDIADKPVLG